MNEVTKWTFEENEGRTVMVEGEPYFVGKDVAQVLGYSNASKAVSMHVDEEDKTSVMLDIADSQNGNVPNGKTKTTLINESGLYSLVLSSKLPTAKKFKRWVTSEVLPAIRKTGSYSTVPEADFSGLSPMLQYLIQMEQKQNELEAKQAELEKALDFNQTEVIKATLAYGRIGSFQQQEIQKTVRLRAIEECHTAQAYDAVGKSVINAIYKALQQYFDIPSYKDLRINQMTEARAFILDWIPHPALRTKIVNASPKLNLDFMSVFTGCQE
ncbi:MAG: ORF6C domain-containing protein [Oscillospiraceae bacterium]|nr:ORF6C domain-containing protein [Oscillospiraceae bacterium]